jgi:hypothetical protein
MFFISAFSIGLYFIPSGDNRQGFDLFFLPLHSRGFYICVLTIGYLIMMLRIQEFLREMYMGNPGLKYGQAH